LDEFEEIIEIRITKLIYGDGLILSRALFTTCLTLIKFRVVIRRKKEEKMEALNMSMFLQPP
jgi:hypothetical protein